MDDEDGAANEQYFELVRRPEGNLIVHLPAYNVANECLHDVAWELWLAEWQVVFIAVDETCDPEEVSNGNNHVGKVVITNAAEHVLRKMDLPRHQQYCIRLFVLLLYREEIYKDVNECSW